MACGLCQQRISRLTTTSQGVIITSAPFWIKAKETILCQNLEWAMPFRQGACLGEHNLTESWIGSQLCFTMVCCLPQFPCISSARSITAHVSQVLLNVNKLNESVRCVSYSSENVCVCCKTIWWQRPGTHGVKVHTPFSASVSLY